ncbi:MAG: hypothetical protein ACRDYA_12670 [Egibacteraceae bacterium]
MGNVSVPIDGTVLHALRGPSRRTAAVDSRHAAGDALTAVGEHAQVIAGYGAGSSSS